MRSLLGGALTRSSRILLLLAGLAFCQAGPLWASSYKVTPVRLVLSRSNSRTLLTLKNESQETLRFQVTVSAWDETPQEEMALQPTRDIVLFPSVLSVAAHEERTLRIASVTPFDAFEKTYRILFEELPPLEVSDAAARSQIRILTRMSIPVFLEPSRVVEESRVEAALDRDTLSLHLKNAGNVHTLVREVRVRGLGEAGETVLSRSLKGWYVLAGSSHTYKVEIPRGDCPKVKRIALEIDTDSRPIVELLDLKPDACFLGGESALQAVLAR